MPPLVHSEGRRHDAPMGRRRSAATGRPVAPGGRSLLLALYTVLRSLKMYPVENATVQKALDDLDASARALLHTEKELEIRTAGDFLFVNATRLRVELDNYASFSHILAMLRAFDIGVLHIRSGMERREWQIFLSLLLSLSQQGEDLDERLEVLQDRLESAKVTHLELERAQPEGGSSEESRHQAKRVYSEGVAVTRDVIAGVRLGRGPRLKRVKRAVQLVVDQVLNNEMSMVGMTTVRDYDEYTFTHSVNVCIFSVALGKKLGFSKVQLYDLGMTALLHDVGKARVPPRFSTRPGAGRPGMEVHPAAPLDGSPDAIRHACVRGDPVPVDSRGPRASHEDGPHRLSQDHPGTDARNVSRIVSVADGFDAATTRRVYNTMAIEPDQVLRRCGTIRSAAMTGWWSRR